MVQNLQILPLLLSLLLQTLIFLSLLLQLQLLFISDLQQ